MFSASKHYGLLQPMDIPLISLPKTLRRKLITKVTKQLNRKEVERNGARAKRFEPAILKEKWLVEMFEYVADNPQFLFVQAYQELWIVLKILRSNLKMEK